MRKQVFAYLLTAVVSCSLIGGAFASTKPKEENKAYLALIIDDFGYDGEGTEEMLELDIPFTAAIMPFSECTAEDVIKVSEAGKEAIIHLPMESKTGKRSWVGDKGIFTDMTDEEIKSVVNEAFDAVDTAVGFNNHMGSAIMEDEKKLDTIMEQAHERGMIFVDSLTTANSVGKTAAEKFHVDYLERSMFIDSPGNTDIVVSRLKKAAEKAKEQGYAVAIGHVGPAGGKTTAEAVKRAAAEIEKMGIEFVTVSEMNEIVNGAESTVSKQ